MKPLKNIIFDNWGLKLISLGLAIITWVYVNNEITEKTIKFLQNG